MIVTVMVMKRWPTFYSMIPVKDNIGLSDMQKLFKLEHFLGKTAWLSTRHYIGACYIVRQRDSLGIIRTSPCFSHVSCGVTLTFVRVDSLAEKKKGKIILTGLFYTKLSAVTQPAS